MEKIKWKDKKTDGPWKHMVQEDRKILIWHCMQHDGILCGVLEGRMLGKTWEEKRRIQLVDDLLEKKSYADLKKAAEDRSVWKTIRKGYHKPAQWADH